MANLISRDLKTIKLSFWPAVYIWSLKSLPALNLLINYGQQPPTAPLNLFYLYERDIWSITPPDGYPLTSGSTRFPSLTLLAHFTNKRCGSLIWPVFLWVTSWGKSNNGWRRVKIVFGQKRNCTFI